MIRVTVSKEGDPVLQVALPKDDIIIGRGHEADVQLTSEAVSRRHARVQRVGGGWQVADLGAANGVYVSSSGAAAPERVVIQPLKPGDRIHIESFVIELEEVEEDLAGLPTRRPPHDETSLATNRTQFISMVDVLAARDAAVDRPNVTGPIMRFVSAEAAPVLAEAPSAAHAPATVSAAPAAPAWFAKMTSASGHERNFTLTRAKVCVGSDDTCEVRLPGGPGVIVELERDGGQVSFRRLPLWPFPRVIVGGRAEKRGYLSDKESFLVGEYEITLQLERER